METAKVADSISGEKLYQQRARLALPLLVRQALAAQPILYSDLASELSMPNPRNLNYVLGSIGQALKALSTHWAEEVPPIQCIVVNKHTGLPGDGISWFISDKDDFRSLPRRQQRRIVDIELQKIYAFRKWPAVLRAFHLQPVRQDFRDILRGASLLPVGGEGEAHRRLKAYVARHPELVGAPGVAVGEEEFRLPSGDSVDVLFQREDTWVAAEVKPATSGEPDLIRGLFQCIKYRAVLEAYQSAYGLPPSARAVLVLEAALPVALTGLKNLLGIEVVQRVEVR